jgi:hypothetical protein
MCCPAPGRACRSRPGVASQRGAASVELVATLPFLALALLITAQIVLVGATLWAAAVSARAGARAQMIGGDARSAARGALPTPLREDAKVSANDGVVVRVPAPELLPGMPPLAVAAHSSLGTGNGGG